MMAATNPVVRVAGKRSPRWAFWSKMTIPCLDGTDYLVRLRIVQTPWFGVYLHDIHKDDGDRAPHNHPWSFVSIVLSGRYTERLYESPIDDSSSFILKTYRRFSIHRMGRDTAHRIVDARPGLKTLIFVGPRRFSWGFFEEGEYIDWLIYERTRLG